MNDFKPLRLEETPLPGCLVVRPKIIRDDRGYFSELFRVDEYVAAGLNLGPMPQWNESQSIQHVLRGLHFQWKPMMGKLMRVARGRAFLVAVDLRKDSPTLGKWFGMEMSGDDDPVLLYAPASFARGFVALSEEPTVIQYLTTGTYTTDKSESGIQFDDPAIGIEWPVDLDVVRAGEGLITDKDRNAQTLAEWLERPESDLFRMEEPALAR